MTLDSSLVLGIRTKVWLHIFYVRFCNLNTDAIKLLKFLGLACYSSNFPVIMCCCMNNETYHGTIIRRGL